MFLNSVNNNWWRKIVHATNYRTRKGAHKKETKQSQERQKKVLWEEEHKFEHDAMTKIADYTAEEGDDER